MNRREKRSYRTVKRAVISVALFLFLLVSLRQFLRSDWLFNRLQPVIVQQLNSQINGSIEIESIHGDLLGEIEIRHLHLTDSRGEQILYADTIRAGYRISRLLRAPRIIDSLYLDGIDLILAESSDGEWNLLSLYQPEKASDPEEWRIEALELTRSTLHLHSESLPDGRISATGIEADLSAGQRPDGLFLTLRHLGMEIKQERLEDPAEFWMRGAVDGNRFTLESLVLETSHSLFTAAATTLLPESAEASFRFEPLSREDLTLYFDKVALEQDLQISLELSGSAEQLHLELNLDAPGVGAALFTAKMELSPTLSISGISLLLEELNLPEVTGDPDTPLIGRMEWHGTGTFPFDNLLSGKGTFSGEILDVRFLNLHLDRLLSEASLENEHLFVSSELFKGEEQLSLEASAALGADTGLPWEFLARSNAFSTAFWLNQPGFESTLRFKASFSGEGYNLDSLIAEATLQFRESRIGNETFSGIEINGTLNPSSLQGTISAQLGESLLESRLSVSDWQQQPEYRFSGSLCGLNLSELSYFRGFPTDIQARFEGSGTGTDPQSLALDALFSFDRSLLNGEPIDSLSAEIRIRNGFLSVERGTLVSPIAEASFTLKNHLQEFTHPQNHLAFEAELKDLSALAPLAGVDLLEAQGEIKGSTAPNESGQLEFQGEMDLFGIRADTLFSAKSIQAEWSALLTDQVKGTLSLSLSEPDILNTRLHNIDLNSLFSFEEAQLTGEYSLIVKGDGTHTALQKAQFSFHSGKTLLITNRLEFESPERILSLEKPFEIHADPESFRMDTLTVSTASRTAFLSLWIPQADSLTNHVGMRAGSIRIDDIQNAFMKEPLAGGLLSGEAEFRKTPDSLSGFSTLELREIQLHEGRMDSLKADLNLNRGGFRAAIQGWNEDTLLLDAAIRIPLLQAEDKAVRLQPEEPLEGYIRIPDSRLEYWSSLLPPPWKPDTSGQLTAELLLSGNAGKPHLTGNFSLSNALLSGIRVDLVSGGFDYLHDEGALEISGHAEMQGQQIAALQGSIPFLIDTAEGSWKLPGEEDPMSATVLTRNFQLSLLNSYLDQEFFRNLSGTLDGNLTLNGTLADLRPEGEFTLRDGTLRIVPAAITLRQVRSRFLFQPDQISIQDFSANSGPGSLTGHGIMELNGFTPENISLSLTGRQFRLINTPQTNAIVNSSLALSGTVEEPKLDGSLTFLSGFYQLQDFGERGVEEVILEDEPEQQAFSAELFDRLEMEMAVRFNRQFQIRNRQYLDMEIELEGELDILKNSNEEMQLFGTLEGARGYMRPLGRLFNLEEAVVSFYGPADDPQLQVRTSYEPPQAVDVTIFYVVEGTLQDPEFRFESDPFLPPRDMISYTLFGRPFYELDSWKQMVTGPGSGPSPTGIAIDLVLDRVEMLASQNLGIDVVQIDNTRSGSSNTTTIKTGWYLNRRTFFAILNEVGGSRPKTLFMIEYLLRDNLELILTQGDDSREGVDLRWRLDY